ncbi:T9SS type A sorting domain-containing protein [Pricia sp. S334]|uniref:T9SS type A sorting domain-containing protein n=1 Tax=Pricia mediterranea TaxID=3076079 RepID=A0ABU3L1H0_9FLAO|nr:T9SS type A sorting domain-containing protein [Pricia sp. S334]MDT7827561.1 T9SS type A sorting domain-containing protein [Pricia sp. S334]
MKRIIILFAGLLLCIPFSRGQSIVSAEYFFDGDPGIGNGIALSVNDNAGQLAQEFSIPTTGLSEGFHSLYIRVNGNNGNWSLYDRSIFYVMSFTDASEPIANAEYFFDEDPGIGEGTALAVDTNSGRLVENMTIPIEGLAEGQHVLYIRVQSQSGNWSLYDQRNFGVTADALDSTVTLDETTITANLADATYQWLDCNDENSPIQGETDQSFEASESGTYAVQITKGDQTVVSACTEISIDSEPGDSEDDQDSENDQEGENDQDNDGVPDALDQCDNTSAGAVVDANGCPVFTLPADNFIITTVGESCISSNNGSIEIAAETSLPYSASLTGPNGTLNQEFSDVTVFQDLVAGAYGLCIQIDGQPDYERCFDVSLTQPEALSASSKVNAMARTLNLHLKGSQTYTITLNDEIITTSDNEITLALRKGGNTITVVGDARCQGIYEEKIVLGPGTLVYPNPIASGNLHVDLSFANLSRKADISLFNLNGALISEEERSIEQGRILLDMDGLPKGVYILSVRTDEALLNQKIIKR